MIKSAQGQPIEKIDLILQGITGAIDGAGAAFLKVTAVTTPKPYTVEVDDMLPSLCGFPWYVTAVSPKQQNIQSNHLKLACVLKDSVVVKDLLQKSDITIHG